MYYYLLGMNIKINFEINKFLLRALRLLSKSALVKNN